MHAFRDVATAAYCPRKLYYRRRQPDGLETPEEVAQQRKLAFEYERLLCDDEMLREAPIAVSPTTYRSRLGCLKARLDEWDRLADPTDTDVLLTGRDCRGIAHKLLAEEPTVSMVFAGEPPDQGVWRPQSVRLVAATRALAWERETPVERAFAEYPAHGVVRDVEIGSRRRAQYREAVRTADAIDGPPPRVDNDAKCAPCEFRSQCGTRTRSLRSLLGS